MPDAHETISARIRRKGEVTSIVTVIVAFMLVAGMFFIGGFGTGSQPNIETGRIADVPAD